MKKILTLLLAVGAVTFAQAQTSRSYPQDRSGNRDVILGNRNDRNDRQERYDGRYENNTRYTYSFSARERDKQIDRINRDYDRQVRQTERNRQLRSSEKSYQLRNLEARRREEIRQVWTRFESRSNTFRDDRNGSYDRRW